MRDGVIPAGWDTIGIDPRTGAGGYLLFLSLESELVTPVLDLTGFTNVQLTFDVAKFGTGGDGPLTVQVSDDGGETWGAQEFDSPIPNDANYVTSGPTTITASGDNVRIRWIRTNSPSQKRLRDIKLTGEPIIEQDGPAIVHTPLPDTESTDERTATATITGNNLIIEGENRPVLHYRVNQGSWDFVYYTMRDGDEFTFVIPGQSTNSTVDYYIAAKDQDGVVTNPLGGSGENPPGIMPPETFYSYEVLEPEPEIDGFVFYLTSDPEDTSEEKRVLYPYAGMGSESNPVELFGDDDWTYIDPKFTFFLVAEGDDEFIAVEFYLNWQPELGDVHLEIGPFLGNQNFNYFTTMVDDGRMRVNAFSLEGNVSPDVGDYLAAVTVTALSPGHHVLAIDDITIRKYDVENDVQIDIPTESYAGEIKFYLGDFGRAVNESIDGTRGDGRIDFNDLMLFAGAYWSERNVDDEYRTKYDIGPTNPNGSYFAMPSPDGVIDFEDLVIFAIGYFYTGEDLLPKQGLQPLRIIVHEIEDRGDMIVVPLAFEGPVVDVRALSLKLAVPSPALTLIEARAAGELDQELGFIAYRELDGVVQIDAAILREPFTQEGVFAEIYFERHDAFDLESIGFVSATARNSSNVDIPVEISRYPSGVTPPVPLSFSISQNYPNPFNPSTIIEYRLAENVHVEIVVYNVLGEEVARLVNEYQESGFYRTEWDGMTLQNRPAPSGMYLYRIQAGEFVETKRMMLVR